MSSATAVLEPRQNQSERFLYQRIGAAPMAKATGQYFNQTPTVMPSKEARDRAVAKKLWEETEHLGRIEYEIKG